MSDMQKDMVIQSRTFDLLNWLLPRAEKFPRLYRHTVVERLVNSVLNFQEHLILAQARQGRERRKQLQYCDEYLIQLRLAHQWHWLNDGQYKHVSLLVAEVGRLLGGWIRQS